jgi:deaminated glutathione amidase
MRILSIFLIMMCWLSVAQGSTNALANFRITMVPYALEGGLVEAQLLKKLEGVVLAALKEEPQLIVLPELISLEVIDNNNPKNILNSLELAASFFPSIVSLGKRLAKAHQTPIMLGSFHRKVGESFLNTSVYINERGEELLQDKIYVTPWEHRKGFVNGSELFVFDVQGVRTVILNCHDVEFPDLSSRLSALRPELILVPSMTDDEFGYQRVLRTSMARAVEHMAFVAQVGTTSSENAQWHTYYGGARVSAPQNKALSAFDVKGELNSSLPFSAMLNFELLRSERAKQSNIHPARDQKTRVEAPAIRLR